jgi:hypothetical protein
MCWPNVALACVGPVCSRLAQGLRTCDPVDPTFCSKWCRVTAVATTVTGAMRWRTNAVQGMWEVQGEGMQGWPVISFLN